MCPTKDKFHVPNKNNHYHHFVKVFLNAPHNFLIFIRGVFTFGWNRNYETQIEFECSVLIFKFSILKLEQIFWVNFSSVFIYFFKLNNFVMQPFILLRKI